MLTEQHKLEDSPHLRPIPVGLCITELEPGGAERCLTELALRLDRRLFVPTVFSLGPPPSSERRQLVERLETAGVDVVHFHGRNWRDVPQVQGQLTQALRQRKIQLLQSFMLHANVLGGWAGWRAKVPVRLGGIRVAERKIAWHHRALRAADRLLHGWVCVSEGVRQHAAEVTRLPSPKLYVIPNGMDESRFVSSASNGAEMKQLPPLRWLIFVGRLDEQKGLIPFFQHLPELFRQLPQHGLLLVGQGPQQETLQHLVSKQGLSERVHFLGFRNDVPALLAASEMFIFPSRWEGMPNVILEAMAAGLPVVSTDAEGVEELLGPAAAQQMVPRDRPEQLLQVAVKLAADAKWRTELGSANRQRAWQEFTLPRMVERYQTLFLKLLKVHNRP